MIAPITIVLVMTASACDMSVNAALSLALADGKLIDKATAGA